MLTVAVLQQKGGSGKTTRCARASLQAQAALGRLRPRLGALPRHRLGVARGQVRAGIVARLASPDRRRRWRAPGPRTNSRNRRTHAERLRHAAAVGNGLGSPRSCREGRVESAFQRRGAAEPGGARRGSAAGRAARCATRPTRSSAAGPEDQLANVARFARPADLASLRAVVFIRAQLAKPGEDRFGAHESGSRPCVPRQSAACL